MTSNKPDLSDLIKRNQQLEKENARLRQELAEERGKHEHTGESTDAKPIYWTAPAAPFEAPKPKFQVGDKVRVVGSASYNADSPFDTIASIEGNCYHINYLNIKTVSAFIYCEDELEPYSE